MTEWQKGMSSPNPLGRPVGIVDKRSRVHKAFEGVGEEIAQVVVEKARGGDMQAANIVLQRISPTLKQRGERVKFALDATQPLARQSAAVVQAVADGDLAPDEAQIVLQCLASHAALVQADEVQARLAALERATGTPRSMGGVVVVDMAGGSVQ